MVKINKKYHMRKRGTGRGKVRRNPKPWVYYAIPSSLLGDLSVIDSLVDNGFRNAEVEWVGNKGKYSVYRVKRSAIERTRESVIDIISNEIGCDSTQIRLDIGQISYAGEKLTMSALKSDLAGFTGTENYYREGLFGGGIQVTDGVRYFQEKAQANWLISDAAVILKMKSKVRAEEFVAIKVKIKNKKVTVNYEDGNNNNLFTQRYQWTDLPDGDLMFYFTNNVMMLPSEY